VSVAACASLVQRGDPDRFAATMAAPVAARAVLFPLYAFNVEVSRAPWLTEEPMIAEMRLQWWRDALEEIAEGRTIRRHEVTTPLAGILDPEGARILDALVAARRWDCHRTPFEDQAALDAYLDATAAGLMWAAVRALGADADAEDAYRDIGWAAGLAALFRAIPELSARGRIPLVDGRPEAVAALAARGLERLRSGARHAAGPATYPAWRAGAILRQVRDDPRRVAEGSLGQSEFRKRATLLLVGLRGRIAG
jgi:phytoene/squalene synthetase